MQRASPRTKKRSYQMAKFYARDTANMFLLWAKGLGVSQHILFESNDVVR